jgi:hypothetical protein
MNKEELRPIEWNTNDDQDMPATSTWKKGWFQTWADDELPNGKPVKMAVIELEDGTIHHVQSHDLRFTDRIKK